MGLSDSSNVNVEIRVDKTTSESFVSETCYLREADQLTHFELREFEATKMQD